jgi:DNA-binding SARP family transcriptional activator
VDFRILGPLEVRANGDRLRLGGQKQRALLAVLLLNANEVVSRDRLIDVLWGEKPPPTASHTLDAYLSRLRKALASDGDGEVRLVTLAPGYALRIAPDQLDLARFERLAADGQRALDAGEPELAAAKLRQAEALWHGRPRPPGRPPPMEVPSPRPERRRRRAAGLRLPGWRLPQPCSSR